ncbi:cell division ATP-binding protein FtsE [Helcococcus ovis]|uniref:Cell division ATP-binding protein FtsE n=1 Tax=Helcococcus ovis TaxID=72026 RepID=A0A4R9C0B0_9FIRM|nr:cell division ATP-binding protein FtsE [Helcococcus ovis]TFF65142.1 cell division ATP-binding protein FtsE [Helcococcus ovis]TFF66385.1 cell division ATP-binding protein FtsE [Helcococcus ovis]TFF68698.1 cell division ATP-binding protein FtsE [Helcococcus ovis]WNZ01639.1 cell division ATP-binding protein FtsE [Helcococcus ovis]
MIRFENVNKKYSDKIVAINNVSFEVKNGEFVFITGASGAGKSTITRLLLKEIDPDGGKLYLMDEDITKVSRRMIPKIRTTIGVVFQDFRLLANRTVYENIEFVLDVKGLSRKDKREKIDEVLDIVHLKHRKKAYPNELSGGEKQRLSIARALSIEPKIILADEPTGNLDPNTAWEIMDCFEEVNKKGTTVVINTHSKEIVDKMQKRVISLANGNIIRDSVGGYDESI